MSKIKLALSHKNLAVGDRLKNFNHAPLMGGDGIVEEVAENFISVRLDGDYGTLTFDARKDGGSLPELMDGWNKSTNTELVRVGDRGHLLQGDTGIPFTYTIDACIPGNIVILKYDDPSRRIDVKDSSPVPVDMKMEDYVAGDPVLEDYLTLAPRNVDGFEEKVREFLTQVREETNLFTKGDTNWEERFFENTVFSIVLRTAWTDPDQPVLGVFINYIPYSVYLDPTDNKVKLNQDNVFSGDLYELLNNK